MNILSDSTWSHQSPKVSIMMLIGLLFNLPWTILAIFAAIISIPTELTLHRHPAVLIIHVRSFWWKHIHGTQHVRAVTTGNVVLLGSKLEKNDLKHELVHIEQYQREPFIHPFLYFFESWAHGHQNNKYEVEAYRLAGNPYKLHDGTMKYYE
jgi:hypothetical protein